MSVFFDDIVFPGSSFDSCVSAGAALSRACQSLSKGALDANSRAFLLQCSMLDV